ncbi:MAG: hypothetical protein AAF989_14330 [Planctomycetota bacterium]
MSKKRWNAARRGALGHFGWMLVLVNVAVLAKIVPESQRHCSAQGVGGTTRNADDAEASGRRATGQFGAPEEFLPRDVFRRLGLQRARGRHIDLVTDLTDREFAADLVQSFDAAVSQWAGFLNLPEGGVDNWKVNAYVMRDARKFRDTGLLPRSVADFPFGTARGNTLWTHDQPSDYYNRHLLLHEGVHALMADQFGGTGPTWFMEGTAELLSVHAGAGGQTTVNRVPVNRESTQAWGRFKLLSQRRDQKRIKTIKDVMRLRRKLNGDVESYGWSWAVVMLLSQYPDTRSVLVEASREGRDATSNFTRRFYSELVDEWPILQARWKMMMLELDYGFDWSREVINITLDDESVSNEMLNGDFTLDVVANQGWQSSGRIFEPGTRIRIRATGEIVLAETTRPWVSLPSGITFRQARGRPIGELLACVLPVRAEEQEFVRLPAVVPVGSECELEIVERSWLLFRVNDALGEMSDNEGSYRVNLSAVGDTSE